VSKRLYLKKKSVIIELWPRLKAEFIWNIIQQFGVYTLNDIYLIQVFWFTL